MLNNTSTTSRTSQNLDHNIYRQDGPDEAVAIARGSVDGNNVIQLIKLEEPQNTTPAFKAAVAYAVFRGWKVFPARMEDGKKYSFLSAEYAPSHENWGMTKNYEQLQQNFLNPKWRLKCGVGLPTGAGNGIFICEADTLKGHGVNGLKALKALEAEHGELPLTLMAQSPSGSIHRYFNHPGPHIKLKSMSIAAGVDVKADGGMVVAPPSVRHDGRYEWLNNEPIADAPSWLIEMIRDHAPRDSSSGGGDPFERLADQWRFEAPIEQVKKDLANISNDDLDWDEWNLIGMATWNATRHSAEGFAAFDRWSQKSSKYDAHTTLEKWLAYFKSPPNNIGAGTLKHRANQERQQRGEEPSSSDASNGKARLMQTSAEFVAGYVPPDYLIDGLLQRRYVYSFTGPTGSGKTAIALRIAAHVALARSLAGREVEKGRVLFFAGENPDDVRSRWIKLCEEMDLDPDTIDVVFMPFTVHLSEKKIRERIDAEASEHGPFALLIVDTSAAYYTGDDENDNVALGNHARMLRTFVELPGGPTILVTCHPTKTPNMENLLPRGGGAFLAEVDGNLACIFDPGSRVAEVTTHGKFRGPDFAPFSFKLVAGQSEKLVDSKGRMIWSIFARPITKEEQEAIEKAGHSDQDKVLRAMLDQSGRSLTELAEHLCWHTMQGEPNKQKVHRVMKDLQKAKLVEPRRDGHYTLTKKGEEEAEKTPEDETVCETAAPPPPARGRSGPKKGMRFQEPGEAETDPFERFANKYGGDRDQDDLRRSPAPWHDQPKKS